MAPSPADTRFAKTDRAHGDERWYLLDNAASFMPGLIDKTVTLVFRIQATLKDGPLHLPTLRQALANIAPRFPYFLVELRRGVFWYYLEPVDTHLPDVVADSRYPCLKMNVLKHGRFLFRVRAYRNRVAVEFCHVLADGSGALIFLNALIREYLSLRGVPLSPGDGIFAPGQEVDPEEHEDAFNRHFRPDVPFAKTAPKAFHVPGLLLGFGQYRVITGKIDLSSILAISKSNDVTLTEYLVSVYMACLQDQFWNLPEVIRRGMSPWITVEVPVNLRRLFPSGTLRNFSLYVLPAIDTRLGRYDFGELLRIVRTSMRTDATAKAISTQIARNVGAGRKLVVRLLPLFMKNFAAKIVYYRMGEATVSGFISNLGPVNLPPEMAAHVDRYEFIPAPSRRCRTNANVVSFGGFLYVSFGSLASSSELERMFFTRLVSAGLPVRVDSNEQEG